MILELGLVAAATAIVLAVRQFRKASDAAPEPQLPHGVRPQDQPVDELASLGAGVGDIIQAGDATRWPRRGIIVRTNAELLCAILLSEEHGQRQASIAMAPPDRQLYWLVEHDVGLPKKPPARLEIDGFLVDRSKLLTVELQAIGDDGDDDWGKSAHLAFYDGSVGDAAVVLIGAVCKVWYGKRLSPGDYDRLGQAERDTPPG